jgi:hypothetical protein
MRAFACILGAAVLCTFGTTAEAQRAAGVEPDLTGIWRSVRGGRAPSAWPADPPFTAVARQKRARYETLVAPSGDTPGGFCVGYGMPASMLRSGGYPMEIIQRPEQITVIYEAHNELRRIYLDGRKPDPANLFPTRNGYSTGQWEGDTLVVETIALKEAVDQESAHSEAAVIVERYRLGTDADGRRTLSAEMTLTDPAFYNGSVTATKVWVAAEKDVEMLSYECTEPQWDEYLENLQSANGN